MNKEQKEKLAHSAANDWCNCYKCDGVVNTTGLRCDKPVAPCMAWYDAYRGAMIALEKYQPTWISVDDRLPEINEEVIVLTDEMNGRKFLSACHISYGHRPNPDGWDGKSIFTGKVTHHDVITYDGWNIPGVKFWMPCPEIPKEEEK